MLEAITKTLNYQGNILMNEAWEFLLPFALVVAFFGLTRQIIEFFEEK